MRNKHAHLPILLLVTIALAICPTVARAQAADAEPKKTQGDDKPATNNEQTQSTANASLPATKTVVEDRTSRATARAKGELNFDDLKFDIEKGGKFERSMLPKEIEELNKKTIRIRGFILPQSVMKMTGFEEFVLVRDNMECCFGPGAALYDCIMVRMEKGKKADFTTRAVAVRGKFEIKEYKDTVTNQHLAIYFLTATEVK